MASDAGLRQHDGLAEGLAFSIIAAYYRPFDKAKEGVNLGPEWPGYEGPEWREQHENLISLRHGFVAHSERDSRRVIVTSTNDGDGWSTRLNLPPLFMVPGEAERTNEMCRDLLSRLHEQLGHACRALIAQERALRPGQPVEVRIPR